MPSARPVQNRWAALYVLCLGMLMIVVDGTIVNVALPSIQDDLGFSSAGLAWVVNAYLVAFGGLLLLAGRVGDLVGQRRVFLGGLVLFTLASLLCGLAQTEGTLIAARFLQGIGGAFASAVILGMIAALFPEPREQAKAFGIFGFVASGGGSLGLIAGGVLTDAMSWHWIFFVNVPIGVGTLLLALRFVPNPVGLGLRGGADLPGAALLTAGLMLGVLSIVRAGDEGWASAVTLGGLLVAAGLIAAFLVRQGRIATPLFPLRLLRSRTVSAANGMQALLLVGMFGMFFLGALYLQEVLGYDPLEVGLGFLPATLVMGIMSLRVAPVLTLRFGPRAVLVPALLAIAAGLALLAVTPVDGQYVANVLPALLLIGLGAGTSFAPLTGLAMGGVAPEDSGVASGLLNTSTQVGGALGIAILATLAAERTESLRAAGEAPLSALNSGFHLGYLIGVGALVVAAAVAATVLRKEEPLDELAMEEAEAALIA